MRWAILGVVACAAMAGFVTAKLHTRWKLAQAAPKHDDCADVPCAHYGVRMMAIRSVIDQMKGHPVYLVIGDSITEFANLEPICGRKPINAGIGHATVETWVTEAAKLADLVRPDFIVVALGTNDAQRKRDNFGERMGELVASLHPYPVVLVPAPGGPSVPDVAPYNAALPALGNVAAVLPSVVTTDGVHLAAATYLEWKAAVTAAVSKGRICGPK